MKKYFDLDKDGSGLSKCLYHDKTQPPDYVYSSTQKRKKIGIILFLIIFLGFLFFLFFRSNFIDQVLPLENTDSIIDTQAFIQNSNGIQSKIKPLNPPIISTQATIGGNENDANKSRIEIPGEIADNLTDSQQHKKRIILINHDKKEQNNSYILQKKLEDSHYTIELASSNSITDIINFVKQYQLLNYEIYETLKDGKSWFVLIQGDFPTISDAENSIKYLHNRLQNEILFVKSGKQVNREKND